MEAPDRRVRGPLVNADGVRATAGRGGVAGTQVLGGNSALVADVMVVHMVLHELFGSSTETLRRSPHVLGVEIQNHSQPLTAFHRYEMYGVGPKSYWLLGKRAENRERVVHSP